MTLNSRNEGPGDVPSSVTVLAATGKIGEIHEGYGVAFDVRSEPAGCRHFTLEAFGIPVDELGRFAEGLQARA